MCSVMRYLYHSCHRRPRHFEKMKFIMKMTSFNSLVLTNIYITSIFSKRQNRTHLSINRICSGIFLVEIYANLCPSKRKAW